jgi:mRNA-degrading endonuclease toxin of MazEF toxin-antitoxin module
MTDLPARGELWWADLDVRVLTDRLGRLGPGRMRELCIALAVATGCD